MQETASWGWWATFIKASLSPETSPNRPSLFRIPCPNPMRIQPCASAAGGVGPIHPEIETEYGHRWTLQAAHRGARFTELIGQRIHLLSCYTATAHTEQCTHHRNRRSSSDSPVSHQPCFCWPGTGAGESCEPGATAIRTAAPMNASVKSPMSISMGFSTPSAGALTCVYSTVCSTSQPIFSSKRQNPASPCMLSEPTFITLRLGWGVGSECIQRV